MGVLRSLLIGISLLGLTLSANANNAERLTKKHCVSCHTLEIPKHGQAASFLAPPINAVMVYVKSELHDKEAQENFIVQYSLNPQKKEAVCKMDKVQKFGVMPSMKGKVSEQDLRCIARHLVKTYPTKEFIHAFEERKLYGEINALKNSPFLMNQTALPHLTKLLIENWGKGKLGLSKCQKKRLLRIRKETISTIIDIKEQLQPLEADIIEMAIDDEEIELMEIKVNEVAKLKAKATIVQLRCLKNTIEVLTEDQLYTLLPLWGM